MKKMLINATQREELRVALVEGKNLYDLDIESVGFEQTKSNIYKGKIAKFAPSLDAVFVDYGAEKHGFLPLKEIALSAFLGIEVSTESNSSSPSKIKNFLKEGQEILVQISKAERGTKGAALTTFISLAGSYLVLMPNNSKAAGISRRIEGAERQALKQQLNGLNIPEDMGVIVRTAGICKTDEDLNWDLTSLLNYWEAICEMAKRHPAPCLIHQEGSILSRAIRDHMRRDIDAILVDDQNTYALVKEKIALFKPEFISKVCLYTGAAPLFQAYQIESQIETAFQREVILPSGGSIVIDSTEALTAIDVNSSRSTKGINIEETAYLTNLEAAAEIIRQFRLRDLGGLVVIDFIDMQQSKHQQTLENKVKELVKDDRARIQVGTLSRFGLLELSRQRLGLSLRESTTLACPRCHGRGTVRSNESLALAILRLLEDAATQGRVDRLCALVPIDIGSYLLNEKRVSISAIEKNYQVKIFVVPDQNLQTPDYFIHHLANDFELDQLSYLLPDYFSKRLSRPTDFYELKQTQESSVKVNRALLSSNLDGRLRKSVSEPSTSLFERIISWFFGKNDKELSSDDFSSEIPSDVDKKFKNNHSKETSKRKEQKPYQKAPDLLSNRQGETLASASILKSPKLSIVKDQALKKGPQLELKNVSKKAKDESRVSKAASEKSVPKNVDLKTPTEKSVEISGENVKQADTLMKQTNVEKKPKAEDKNVAPISSVPKRFKAKEVEQKSDTNAQTITSSTNEKDSVNNTSKKIEASLERPLEIQIAENSRPKVIEEISEDSQNAKNPEKESLVRGKNSVCSESQRCSVSAKELQEKDKGPVIELKTNVTFDNDHASAGIVSLLNRGSAFIKETEVLSQEKR